ncbi:MAG: shikimate kinase, partial [Pseudomonadota bacterium]
MQNFQKPIVLIGMMGSGKSALAEICADITGFTRCDSDAEVEKRAGKAIKDIFAEGGEAHFRALERAVMLELLESAHGFIATGGGVVLDADVRAAMKDKAITVWIDVPVDVLYERIKEDKDRPLLQTEDPKAAL